MSDKLLLYWDACVFLSLINGEEGRVDDVQALMEEAEEEKLSIITSSLSIVEVAYGLTEQQEGELDEEVEDRISGLWISPVIGVIDVHPLIVDEARTLIRSTISAGLTGLRSADAIHLATASHMKADAIHTYDGRMGRFAELVKAPIGEPTPDRPKLPGLSPREFAIPTEVLGVDQEPHD